MRDPNDLLAWMMQNGPQAAGMALEAFNHGADHSMYEPLAQAFAGLDPAFAREVLQATSVQSVGKLLAQMGDRKGADIAKLLAALPLVKTGAILGELPDDIVGSLLRSDSLSGKGKELSEARENYKRAKFALSEAEEARMASAAGKPRAGTMSKSMSTKTAGAGSGKPSKEPSAADVARAGATAALADAQQAMDAAKEAVALVDPQTAAELLSGVQADIASTILERLPTDFTSGVAEAFSDNAGRLNRIRSGLVQGDVTEAIERIRNAADSEEMVQLIKEATALIEDKMQLKLTVCQYDPSDDFEKDEPGPTGSAPSPSKDGVGEGDISYEESVMDELANPDIMREMEILATSELELPSKVYAESSGDTGAVAAGGKGSRSPGSRTNKTASRSPSPGPRGKGGRTGALSEDDVVARLDAQLATVAAVKNSQGLSEAQSQALESRRLTLLKQHVVVPVYIKVPGQKDEMAFGTISASAPTHPQGPGVCPNCGAFLTADHAHPMANTSPQAVQVMSMMAAAIKECAGRVVGEEMQEIARLETVLEQSTTSMVSIQTADLKELKKMKKVSTLYAGRVGRKLRSSAFLHKQLAEIKRYNNPPKVVIRIISSMLVILNQPGIKANMGAQYSLPEDKGETDS